MFDIKNLSQFLITNPDEFMHVINEEPQKFSIEFAQYLDSKDPLKSLRDCFDLGETISFAGHSLGPAYLPGQREIDRIYELQRKQLHEGHFPGTEELGGNWFDCDIETKALVAMQQMLGFSDLSEFVFTQTGLSCNLGILLDTFYKPSLKDWRTGKTKICHLGTDFFSDQAIIHSLIERNIDTADGFQVFEEQPKPKAEELTLKLQPDDNGIFSEEENIIDAVKKNAHEIKILHLSDVIFSTGQRLDIHYILSQLHEVITKYDIKVGLDLAHTVGNRLINLTELKHVSYAVGCAYKHCGGTAGSGFGFYVNQNMDLEKYKPLQGWKAADSSQVFANINGFKSEIMQQRGAWAFRTSNTSPVAIGPIKTFAKQMCSIGWDKLIAKSECLTRYMHALLTERLGDKIQLITPIDPKHRGAMLVFRVKDLNNVLQVEEELKKQSDFGKFEIDVRKPNNIRITAHYGYTRFADIHRLVSRLEQVIEHILSEQKHSQTKTLERIGFLSSQVASQQTLTTSAVILKP